MRKQIDLPDEDIPELKVIAIKAKAKSFKEWIEKLVLKQLKK